MKKFATTWIKRPPSCEVRDHEIGYGLYLSLTFSKLAVALQPQSYRRSGTPFATMFLRRLNLDADADRSIASELFLSNPSYELENYGRLPTAGMDDPLWRRFPDECAPEHRLTFAAFDHDRPIGLAQVALHLPTRDCAALLLLLVPGQVQQQHIGCEIVERLSKQARRWPDISNWYITVVEANTRALAFWRHCGFRTKTQGLACAGFASHVTLMTRAIKTRPVCQHSRAPENGEQVMAQRFFARIA